jgi:hypothetical protein
MSAETCIIIVSAALLFAIRAGVSMMSHALDRLTSSVSDAVSALNDATARAGNAGQGDDAALGQLADSLDAAVSAYRAASVASPVSGLPVATSAGEAAPDSATASSAANPLDPDAAA